MNQTHAITTKYAERIGKVNERASFIHSAEAAEAARELATVTDSEYITKNEYNVIWRIGQVLGDARYFAAVSHEVGEVYMFTPARIS